jgi:AcrR family transcriptional regulator
MRLLITQLRRNTVNSEEPDRKDMDPTNDLKDSSRPDKVRIPKQSRSMNTRQLIIDAAVELFSQKGYHHTNSKEITAAAGVATGSFYAYFKDKREVFIESLKVYQAKFNEQVKDYLEKHLTNPTDSRQMVSGLIRVLIDAHELMKGLHNDLIIMRLEDVEVDTILKEEEKLDIETTRNGITHANDLRVPDLDAASIIVYSTVHRIVDLISMDQSDIPRERLIEETSDMISRYLFGK